MNQSGNIGYILQHLAFAMSRQNDQILQERLGIGFSQYKILMVLERNPNIKQKRIADSLGQTEASISRQIALMTDKGLLQTTINPANRRVHITTLTNKGIRLVEESARILNNYHSPMFERLSEKQQAELALALGSMHEYVCANGKTGACQQPFTG